MRSVLVLHRFRQTRWWLLLVRPLAFLVASFLVARLLVSLVGAVDWHAVASALSTLHASQVVVLLAMLLVRQAFNSVPLTVFVPGLSFWRGFQNDLTANLVATVAPPPADVVVRVSMFRSWGIAATDGMPGVVLNTLTFYVIRFSVPVLGLLVLVGEDLSRSQVWSAVLSFAVAAAIVVALVLVARGERTARLVGREAARVASRFRSDVDARAWSEAVAGFRATMSARLTRGLVPALAALAAMVVTDATILLTSLRFVGVDGSVLTYALVLGGFFLAYPLTALPLAGLGVLDAVLVVAFTEAAGTEWEAQIVAALIVWRAVTLIGTELLGVATFGWWRWRTAVARTVDAQEAG